MAKQNSNTSIIPVLLVNFIGMLGYSIVIPILVYLVQKFGGNELIYGLVGSLYPLFQLFGAPYLGKLSDRIGRRRVLIISQAGTFFAWSLFIIALCIPITNIASINSSILGSFTLTIPLLLLFFSRALDGLTGGNISVANAYLADISTEENRKANFGKMASSTSLGFVIGPAMAGVLAGTILGELLPVIIAAVISLIAIFVIKYYLPESQPNLISPDQTPFATRKLYSIEQKECYQMRDCQDTRFWGVLKIDGIKKLFFIYFFTFLGFSIYQVSLPVYAATQLGWTPGQLGMYLTVSSILMVCAQGPGLSYLSSRVGDLELVIGGCISMLIGFYFMSIPSLTTLYIAVVFIALGNGTMWPSYLSILTSTGPANIRGTIQGYANSMGSLASILGLLVGGMLFMVLGTRVFLISTTAFIIILLLSISMRRTSKSNISVAT